MLQGNRSIPTGGGGNGNITPMPMEFLLYVYFEYREEMSRLISSGQTAQIMATRTARRRIVILVLYNRNHMQVFAQVGPFGATYDQMRHRYERWRKWLLPLQEVSGLAGWTNTRYSLYLVV
ncbi:hypothetical protein L6452_14766 [Arctium lappa]|uniref:Uncharacterized protein n=1 Tax=Arctium lappa TaxID=4217 RepID=A0ACB9CLX6_ARCLA|nr:hypothetical protein L6452_14766 [Arctium lappa]